MKKLSEQFGGGDSETKIIEYEREIEKLLVQVASMEQELKELRQSRTQLEQAFKQNEKLAATLVEAKNQIEALKKEVEKLTTPPSSYAIFSGANEDGTVNVFVAGRKMKVNIHPNISIRDLKKGQQVLLNEALNAIEACEFDVQGEVVRIKDLLENHRAIVTLRAEEERVVELADPLMRERLSVGDHLLYDVRSGYVLEKLPKSEIEEVVLEEIPDVTYDHIGGLEEQIELVRDAVELPFLHPEVFAEHKLLPPKGILLYGPPGCGKTLIAKAVAASIARKLGDRSGREMRSFFLHVKGPELLNKYVGESERQIREVFKKAKERAEAGHPVIVFFDEMDALFRTRGSGISSDMEATIVPQFLSEIDGVERLRNVIVIGASNRQDLLDPAILRAGRLDIKIKIERPDKKAAVKIFHKYLTRDLPYHPEELERNEGDSVKVAERLIHESVEEMYSVREENKFLEVTYANGEKETFFFKDFSSGAMIEGVVSRAKKHAIKRMLESGVKGLKQEDLIRAIKDEFKENEDLPNTTNPDDWAKIAGRKSEKIIHVRTMAGRATADAKKIETVTTGHYL
ncbi:proteasome ATPase [Candidatus Manganitrophus noduliformans]|uniref:Proteasome ATPase n=1 Tax=Candidatus Manganitrophus noduliformans TaxID=2606439 RepID=A0A7X6DNJ1_9BACT|nr:proteasome ATPase [Candidatus Manganitrophus noduliformans]